VSVSLFTSLVAAAVAPAPDAPPADAPAPAPPPAADAPAEVVVRVDPLDTPAEPDKRPTPQPDPDPTTEHYGIPSRQAGKDSVSQWPDPPKNAPSEEAAARDTEVKFDNDSKPKRRDNRPGTPQRFELEFKLGPYLPVVDRRYDGPGLGPYATIFGRTNSDGVADDAPKVGVMPVLGFEWQFLYLAGPLGIGTQVGFFRDKAKALLVTPDDDGNVRSAADDTSFGMVPLALLATYRFEYLADRLGVPLVPYAKGGLAYAFWWTKDGSGEISRNSEGQKGSGGVAGWQANAGLMLRLDFLEPGTAKAFDRISGINHTYLFGDYQLSRIANFGAGSAIALGDNTWFAGLAIEF